MDIGSRSWSAIFFVIIFKRLIEFLDPFEVRIEFVCLNDLSFIVLSIVRILASESTVDW